MNNFQIKLEGKWTTTSSDISVQSQDGPRKNVLSLKDENEEFVTEFNRVINHEDINTLMMTTATRYDSRTPT